MACKSLHKKFCSSSIVFISDISSFLFLFLLSDINGCINFIIALKFSIEFNLGIFLFLLITIILIISFEIFFFVK